RGHPGAIFGAIVGPLTECLRLSVHGQSKPDLPQPGSIHSRRWRSTAQQPAALPDVLFQHRAARGFPAADVMSGLLFGSRSFNTLPFMTRFSHSALVASALACSGLSLFAQAPDITATKTDGTPAATKKNPG